MSLYPPVAEVTNYSETVELVHIFFKLEQDNCSTREMYEFISLET